MLEEEESKKKFPTTETTSTKQDTFCFDVLAAGGKRQSDENNSICTF